MRSRAEMKTAAKQNFARNSGVFLAIGALLMVAGLVASAPIIISSMPSAQQMQNLVTRTSDALSRGSATSTRELNQLIRQWLNIYSGGRNYPLSLYLFALFMLLLLGVSVLQVGLSHTALMASAGNAPKFKDFFAPLKSFSRWLGLYLMIFVRVFLWSCLFIIPGIIAAYGYRQAVYLMLEDPELGVNKALNLSGKLMDGYRLPLFALEMSFILWVLLGSLISALFGVDVLSLYLTPYRELTHVQFYYDLRREHPIEELSAVVGTGAAAAGASGAAAGAPVDGGAVSDGDAPDQNAQE